MKTKNQTNLKNLISKLAQITALILVTALLAGCGNKVSGKYSNELMTIEFKSGGKAVFTMGVLSNDATYEIQGDKIILHDPKSGAGKDDITLTRKDDGTLALMGEMGSMILKKQK